MKKIKIGMIVLSIILLMTATCYATETSWTIIFETESTNITKTQELVKIDIILKDYQGDGILGYEGELIYDQTIFEEVTITALNDWDNVSYDKTTGKFLSTTTTAKNNTTIAQITLKLKSNITAESTNVTIKDLTISDGSREAVHGQIYTYQFPYNEEQQPTQDEIRDTNTNDKIEQEEKTTVKEINTSTETQQDLPKQLTVETVEDNTKAQTSIPQTGVTPIEVIIVAVIIVCGIIGYGKYRSIPLK